MAVHLDDFANGILALEETVHHVAANHRHVPAMQVVEVGIEAAVLKVGVDIAEVSGVAPRKMVSTISSPLYLATAGVPWTIASTPTASTDGHWSLMAMACS